MEQAIVDGTWIVPTKDRWGDPIEQFNYKSEMSIRESNDTFLEIRNLLLMMVLPKRINQKDSLQSAYLRAAIARVSYRLDKIEL